MAAGAWLFGAGNALAQTPPTPPKAPEQLGEIPIDKLDPVKSVPTPEQASRNPLQFGYLLMDLATQAELAEKRGDFADAVRYYQALAKAVPHRSISYGKMCAAYEALGDRDSALTACRSALGREGARVEDHARTVRLLLAGQGPLAPAEKDDVLAIANHLKRDPGTASAADEMHCQLATRIQDTTLLETCVAGLTAAAPRHLTTISYRWALALEKRDFAAASHLVSMARAAGLDAAGVERMQRAVSERQWRHRLPRLGGAALLLVGLGFLGRRWFTHRRGGGPVLAFRASRG
jgi:hypothetical protein